ncbi:2-C-methyl-D-erythritol 2,4-cyclodiphosphate synthase [Treponema pedis]|uniref:2-C-methyl-D-erythritol 2,4-cyclodiphosphate synthase n=1 Tax=Treponema pedis TaxID=409322 RepID=A0A7S6WM70_9SPIR|nr:2-C-methyl-D-erythritol 2,4-cyclodiphosphate synthase [Treponema pedis]QOW59703.1 2-C-methyl-D-erythritol 2,4-cyclodiphosphate synthase [Treponema pedis]QSI05073.1 2-C-methyl-D-erythritol 2,4-cyclodiphosphate synthase [Treponema pedis]
MRTGLGYDLHKLVRGRKLMLGGVHIPFKKGEAAHSDGDVLLHAVTDSLLGASGMGDIGEFFPPEDKTWKNADSAELLKIVREKINGAGWKIENIDCVILIEKPKILPYREIIRESIADILKIKKDSVFVKAKTGEGLGIIGRGRAVASFVSSLLTRT